MTLGWWGCTQMDTVSPFGTRLKGKDGRGRKQENLLSKLFSRTTVIRDSSGLWSFSVSGVPGCLSWGLFLGEGEGGIIRLRQIDG